MKGIWQKLFLLLLFACLMFLYFRTRREERSSLASSLRYTNGAALTASFGTGFYHDALDVEFSVHLEIPDGAKIRYTQNGDDPSGKSDVYAGPIHLDVPEEGADVVPLKARIFYRDEMSEIFSWTYVIGKQPDEEFSLPVISVTSGFSGLYSYEHGIIADGIMKDMARAMGRSTYSVGNYFQRGDEWVRNCRVTMFDAGGKLLLDQNAGLAVSGRSSRARSLKSFKITAGEPYDHEHERFRLDIFQDTASGSLSYVNEFTNLKLRTTDMQMRSFSAELGEKLAAESGYPGYQHSRPALLFLNGVFYSIVDVQPSYSDSYISRRFGLPDSDHILKYKKVEDDVFNALYFTRFMKADLTLPRNREVLERRIDMDDYLLYYAIQVLLNNTDWPGNNYEAWRYSGFADSWNRFTDGRARFLIYDLDFIYSRSTTPVDERGYDVFINLMENEYYASMSYFSNVMKAKEYRDRFVTIVTDLLNTSFESSHIKSVMEQAYIKKRGEILKRWGEETDTGFLRYIQSAEETADSRAEEMAENFKTYFGLEERYKLEIEADEGVRVSWNQMKISGGNSYTCRHYTDTVITCKAEAYEGYRFLYWLVNGKKVKGETLSFDGGSAKKGKLGIRAVSERMEGPLLLIDEISAKSQSDWIRLANAGTEELLLSEYYLSDSPEKPMKYRMPEKTLLPGETVIINGDKNYYAVGEFISNFSLHFGETLTLYHEPSGETVSCVIPRMSRYETWGRDPVSGEYIYYSNLDEQRKNAGREEAESSA